MSHPGLEDAVIRYQSSSFEKELDRTSRLIPCMKFLVLLLQGDKNDGQPPFDYDDAANPGTPLFHDARLERVPNCGHYTSLEKREAVMGKIEAFLSTTSAAQ